MDHYAATLLEIGAVKLQPSAPFTWASGWKSPIYCDNRQLLSYPEIRNDVVCALMDLLLSESLESEIDCIVGVATGAIAWGTLVADALYKPFAYVRSAAKDHGLGNRIEGVVNKGDQVVVIEDLISTGGSSLSAVEALRERGANVLNMTAIMSYGFDKAEQAFADAGVVLNTVTNYSKIVEAARKQNLFGEEELALLAEWRKTPDTWGK